MKRAYTKTTRPLEQRGWSRIADSKAWRHNRQVMPFTRHTRYSDGKWTCALAGAILFSGVTESAAIAQADDWLETHLYSEVVK